jgi:hypothetical protein
MNNNNVCWEVWWLIPITLPYRDVHFADDSDYKQWQHGRGTGS